MIETITAAELATLLDRVAPPPAILSLDCFDTLLWRNGHCPRDVFADLVHPGGAMEPRMWAETRARQLAHEQDGSSETTIEAIYAALMPGACDAARAQAVAAELAAEARHCFAFAPTVALIRAAKARGMRVIVVSDTYLAEPQLRALIAAAAGEDVIAAIDRIFCSSEHGVGKVGGLFRPVLAALDIAPGAILHIGDNKAADAEAPRALGIRAVHLRQFDAPSEQRLRLEAAAAAIVDPATRVTVPMLQPHRATIALRHDADAAAMLGHDVFGPLMHAFAQWIGTETARLAEAHGRPVKPLFLLRDGYLPHAVFKAIGGSGGTGAAIEISRFSARRAAFTDAAAVRDYLRAEPTTRTDVLANQLLLTPGEAAKFGRDHKAFRRAVVRAGLLDTILARSSAYADRLVRHVATQSDVAPGDTVMLVDLGYNGTVQNLIAPLLTARLGVEVAGRYLLLRESAPSGLDKRGLFDTRHYDNKTLHSLCHPIAVIEQICTAAQGSVVDYDANGRAIRKAPGIKGAQSALRERMQAAALDFAAGAEAGFHRAPASDDCDARRRMAMAILARLLFLPQAEEVTVLAAFDHDVNLGTDDLEQLIDAAGAQDGLRRRGLSYLNDVSRMYLPGELQPHGLPLNLALFGVSRLGIELRAVDFQVSSLAVPVIVTDGARHTVTECPAYPTHDGFHVMTVPVGAGRFTLGVQLGAIADWVQIEEIAFHTVADYADSRGKAVRPIPAQAVYDAMEAQGGGLYRCAENGLIFVPPPAARDGEPLLLAISFRPIVARRQMALRRAA